MAFSGYFCLSVVFCNILRKKVRVFLNKCFAVADTGYRYSSKYGYAVTVNNFIFG